MAVNKELVRAAALAAGDTPAAMQLILQQPAPNHHTPLQYYPPPQYSPQFHIPIPPPLQYSYHFQTGAFPIADGRPMISGGGQPMLPTTATKNLHLQHQKPPPLPEFRGDGYYFLPTGSGWKKVPYSDVVPCEIPTQPSPVVYLRANVVRQIEYYFCDENIKEDYHLISLMDNQGWVSISKIAEFRMIKRMNVDIPFILNALKSSKTIQVQGEKIRRRNDWSRWLPVSDSQSISQRVSQVNSTTQQAS